MKSHSKRKSHIAALEWPITRQSKRHLLSKNTTTIGYFAPLFRAGEVFLSRFRNDRFIGLFFARIGNKDQFNSLLLFLFTDKRVSFSCPFTLGANPTKTFIGHVNKQKVTFVWYQKVNFINYCLPWMIINLSFRLIIGSLINFWVKYIVGFCWQIFILHYLNMKVWILKKPVKYYS